MAETVTETRAENRYKIGDVCRIADVQPYVLRYWESEFSVLAPDRAQSGPRTYSSRELKIIEQIKRLLYDEGYTIAGAKKRLESEALATARAEALEDQQADEDEKKARRSARGKSSPAVPAQRRASVQTLPGILPSPSAEAPAVASVESSGRREAPAPDPRLPRVVSELKAILKLLSP